MLGMGPQPMTPSLVQFGASIVSANQSMRAVKRQAVEKLVDVIPRKNRRSDDDDDCSTVQKGDFFGTNPWKTCSIRNIDGVEESVDMDDLVDIVLLAAESINKDKTGDLGKRKHSRRAACRYREKRKERWLKLQKERVEMERTNAKLKDLDVHVRTYADSQDRENAFPKYKWYLTFCYL
ncbi:unnamed protein product [Haemonchus placei]|uniref:BZIP domain-containing protein n=1 Tax=Haemonchus placei TaxID=6290 RepID=A0A158QML1_HAEPC|nr:unnamed protein product [Haemonchus placei]